HLRHARTPLYHPPPPPTPFPYTTLFRSYRAARRRPATPQPTPSGSDTRRSRRFRPVWKSWLSFDNASEAAIMIFSVVELDVLDRSEEHTSELQSRVDLVCRLLLEKKKVS